MIEKGHTPKEVGQMHRQHAKIADTNINKPLLEFHNLGHLLFSIPQYALTTLLLINMSV